MLNELLITLTDLTSYLLYNINFRRILRPQDDLRLVYYHSIGDGNSPCMRYLDDEILPSVFKTHLDFLQNNYNIMSIEDAVQLLVNDGISQNAIPICCISFDDGLRSVYSEAFPLLRARKIPFTVFVNTSVIGNKSLLFLHLLSYLLSHYGGRKISSMINQRIANIPPCPFDEREIGNWVRRNFEVVYESEIFNAILEELTLDLAQIANEEKLYLDWNQIEEMSCHDVGFFSHTANHAPLGAFGNLIHVKNEIETALRTITAKVKKGDIFVSFPFGMESDYGNEALKLAFSAGHKYVVEVGNGVNPPNRIRGNKILSRVDLGNVNECEACIYSAIELRPLVKDRIKTLLRRRYLSFP
jgi:peptidoglycan/xylan/chitin deacetylase (PgdA/CDA1 family)